MTFGEKLKGLRKEKGYSQEELAGLLEVSRQAVSKWESDITRRFAFVPPLHRTNGEKL